MTAKGERAEGLEILTEILSRNRILQISEQRTFHDGYSFYFKVVAYGNGADFCIPSEVLEDMKGTPRYREYATNFARAVEKRLRNPDPQEFMTKTGVPLEIESFWPSEAWPGRAASWIRTNVRDPRDSKLAKCSVVMTHQQQMYELKENPFLEFGGIINSVRDAVDAGSLVFHQEADHPNTFQRVDLRIEPRQREKTEVLEMLLERKIFWLGFKKGNANTSVWVADPWDADYLGVPPGELIREAELLEARSIVQLDESRLFASAGKGLLLRARALEADKTAKSSSNDEKLLSEWDIFISHASEDKETFVQPLAEALIRRGLRVWYDKFTMKLGDSLREKIDYGLKYSRFGLVVLSPQFFSKEWPKKELDGLVALEINGRKVILPIWHNVNRDDVAHYSPILAGRVAVSTSTGLDNVVGEIIRAIL